MLAYAFWFLAEAATDTSEEGLDVITAMLGVGLVFLAVIVIGDGLKAYRHRRKS